MNNKLYHPEVYWPAEVIRQLPNQTIGVVYTKHAKQAAKSDRYGHIDLPNRIDMDRAFVFEAELNSRLCLTKFGVRISLDNERDLCLIITCNLRVKTVWVNLRADEHKTLNKNKYVSD